MASSQGKNELRFADWMAALPGSIHRTPLTNLAIPEEEYILLNHMHCDTYPRGTNICGGPLPAQSTSQWLGTISKTVIFGQESSLPRIRAKHYFGMGVLFQAFPKIKLYHDVKA
ncbi:hypothetical protein Q9233_011174 [Columba guinea]|nr:hypothetical protein Q9233_011174 [Columba guinea]